MSLPKVSELISLLPPPETPLHTDVDWDAVETDIGLQLPTDYKQIIAIYGNVSICEVIGLVHPHHSEQSWRELQIKLLNDVINSNDGGRDNLPYPDYPKEGGILPVASVFEHLLCWVTAGPADSWTLLYWSDWGTEVVEYKMSISEFLVEVLSRRLDFLPNTWLDPDGPYRKAEAQKIYELFQPPDEYYRKNRPPQS